MACRNSCGATPGGTEAVRGERRRLLLSEDGWQRHPEVAEHPAGDAAGLAAHHEPFPILLDHPPRTRWRHSTRSAPFPASSTGPAFVRVPGLFGLAHLLGARAGGTAQGLAPGCGWSPPWTFLAARPRPGRRPEFRSPGAQPGVVSGLPARMKPSPRLPCIRTVSGHSRRRWRTGPLSWAAGWAASQSQSRSPSPRSGFTVK